MRKSLPCVKWLVIDGLPYTLLNKYLDHNTMPCLSRAVEQGWITALDPLWPNCQTPPSLLSIWSGQSAIEHNILGYDTPDGDQAGVFRNGFVKWPNTVELVWETWARAGYDVRLNHVPFVNEENIGERLVSRSTIYGNPLYESQVFEGSTSLQILGFDLKLSTKYLSDRSATLIVDYKDISITKVLSLDIFHDVALQPPLRGALTLMLTLSPIGVIEVALLGKNQYLRSGREPARTGHPLGVDFCHDSLAKHYRSGKLGAKKSQGGNGLAEKKLFASLERVHLSFYRELLFSFMEGDADLTVGYYPVVDLALHEIIGLEALSSTDPDILGYFKLIMHWVESVLAILESCCRDGELFVVNSDHGMQPVTDVFYINYHLSLHGLLEFDESGNINYSNTLAAYHPAENGTLLIHKSCDTQRVFDSICKLFKEAGFNGAEIIRVPGSLSQHDFDASWFLLPPDGVRVKATISDRLVRPSDKSGDHCGYSNLLDLKGTLISNHAGKRPSPMKMHDIKEFIMNHG
ncbi:alkaline phosphatase family protein [Pseudomonas guariconensis]|uniref:alkaline phosphatase family protein n=1 Tax=Pseudomonas guariconensis TaxID=1288410 RepID=UPI0018AB4755|nr:alkaline phosphatase family protein [Pseudomonas guariconensis]MBF8742104.1 alkaline phosphatase family protein [Pseudomonas guariconensis]MBF8751100.1 alkaline phosphatase family protein [Pseudomonas guariconensis]